MIYNNLGTSGGAKNFFFTRVIQRTNRQISNILSSTERSSSTAVLASERAPMVIRNSSSAVSTSDRASASASYRAPVVINNSPICPNFEGSLNNVLINITTMTNSAQNNPLFYGATLNIQNFHLHINKEYISQNIACNLSAFLMAFFLLTRYIHIVVVEFIKC